MTHFLTATKPLTKLMLAQGVVCWNTSIKYVQNLPYGRNPSRTNLSQVLNNRKGTCSSKHALLKTLADQNNISGVSLHLGIYKMNGINTPKVKPVLLAHYLEFIPEAHCYLKLDGVPTDLTSTRSNFKSIADDLLTETIISPKQIGDFKVQYHQNYLKEWLKDTNLKLTFNQLWSIREKCIESLSS